jgi:hypothetical protein
MRKAQPVHGEEKREHTTAGKVRENQAWQTREREREGEGNKLPLFCCVYRTFRVFLLFFSFSNPQLLPSPSTAPNYFIRHPRGGQAGGRQEGRWHALIPVFGSARNWLFSSLSKRVHVFVSLKPCEKTLRKKQENKRHQHEATTMKRSIGKRAGIFSAKKFEQRDCKRHTIHTGTRQRQ